MPKLNDSMSEPAVVPIMICKWCGQTIKRITIGETTRHKAITWVHTEPGEWMYCPVGKEPEPEVEFKSLLP